MTDKNDIFWMQCAIEQAKLGFGLTSPNPIVGAVVVKDGQLIGQGYHHKAGTPHAEPNALDDALRNAPNAVKGATLYVTLEPCSTFGRTPPCTKRIIEEGIARIVIGTLDKNPLYCGAAVKILQDSGIDVDTGVLEEECEKMNETFFWWITQKKPFVLLKMAMTLDGRIATANGSSQWITGSAARAKVQEMRRWADAIMVGGTTVLADNPSLTVRSPANWPCQPRRFVWTSQKQLPANCKLLTDGNPPPELVKPVSPEEWSLFLQELGKQNVTALLLEGGGELAASALQAGAVNKVAFFVAPKILGGRNARPVVGGMDTLSLDDALALNDFQAQPIGNDILLTGYCLHK